MLICKSGSNFDKLICWEFYQVLCSKVLFDAQRMFAYTLGVLLS